MRPSRVQRLDGYHQYGGAARPGAARPVPRNWEYVSEEKGRAIVALASHMTTVQRSEWISVAPGDHNSGDHNRHNRHSQVEPRSAVCR